MKALDRHGFVDFRLEGFENVYFDKAKEAVDLTGCSINVLLYVLFILNGFNEGLKNKLPGGVECWDLLLETMYSCVLPTKLTIYELIYRVRLLVVEYLEDNESLTTDGRSNDSWNLVHGALSTLHTWIANFHAYLSDIQLTQLRQGIVSLGNLGLRTLNLPSNDCGEKYRRLEVLVDVVTWERNKLTLGIHSSLSTSAHCDPFPNLSIYDPKWYPFIKDYQRKLSQRMKEKTCYQYIYHDRIYNRHSPALTQPTLPRHEGAWDSQPIERRRETKKAIESEPKFKLDIFGGDSFLNKFEDEDEEDDPQVQADTGTTDEAPIPRVPMGQSLLRGPVSMFIDSSSSRPSRFFKSEDNVADLWSFELVEIARQWTLIDHAMFCSIPLHSLIMTAWQDPRHALSSIPYKKFSDRFNALSLWGTTCILREDEVEKRAAKYGQIVSLAGELLDLDNYNGAMALISALQQGCITRLEATVDLVDKKEKDLLISIQRRLSDGKNYAVYRQELEEKVRGDERAWRGRASGDDPKMNLLIPSVSKDPQGIVPYLGVFTMDLASVRVNSLTSSTSYNFCVYFHRFMMGILITCLRHRI